MNKKIAIVTGASSGVGQAVAMHLAENDYFVILLARNQNKLNKTCETILEHGGTAVSYSVDVSQSTQVKSSIDEIVAKYGQIDLLFNNAGILMHGTTTLPDNDIDALIKTNLNGAIYVAKYVALQMKSQRNGYIINLSSAGGKVAASFAGIYAASKFGLCGFSEALHKEMAPYHVKVTNICPHMIATEMTAGRKFKPEDMIQTTDLNKTVSYLLGLSKNAIPAEIIIQCLPFVAKTTENIYKTYGVD